ncbi:MAG: hypothetical protein J0I43_08880 [Microbacterium sp.]|uniref:hypothetical protein n=1 Tax=Microbacterium sp. TaxID=51671 RepID=UPI001AD3947A|nr:hypothetical protein [Microbacterium sp.]MBN9177463.1 hypothetical protein [Microbacterium sp.]
MTSIDRELFARLADELIPAVPGFPAPSEIGVHTTGLDRLARVRPDLIQPLEDALVFAADHALDSASVLRDRDPARFSAVTSCAAGIYLTEPVVTRAYGYPGRPPLDVGEPHERIASYTELARPVVDRGSIWASTPAPAG